MAVQPGPKIRILRDLHDYYNEVEFNGRLTTPKFGLTRSRKTDGWYEHSTHNIKGKIAVSIHCFKDQDLLEGTVLHEMIHQYQNEILKRRCNHDAIFTSIARRMEREYGFRVR